MKTIILTISVAICLLGCTKDESSSPCQAGSPNIIGANFNDGTTSSATGSGACSSHGGVKSWVCN